MIQEVQSIFICSIFLFPSFPSSFLSPFQAFLSSYNKCAFLPLCSPFSSLSPNTLLAFFLSFLSSFFLSLSFFLPFFFFYLSFFPLSFLSFILFLFLLSFSLSLSLSFILSFHFSFFLFLSCYPHAFLPCSLQLPFFHPFIPFITI